MDKPTVIFFGSFLEYSVQVLEKLHTSNEVDVLGVVTTPPRPAGRKQELTKTHVHQYAESHQIPVFTPEKLTKNVSLLTSHSFSNGWNLTETQVEESSEDTSKNTLDPSTTLHSAQDDRASQPINQLTDTPDLFVVAGYGKLLPKEWLEYPKMAPINIHFSLLPKYRGAMPGEWALMMEEAQTGVSLIEMSPQVDAGNIYAQATYEITTQETRETLYTKLYDLGADLFLDSLASYLQFLEEPEINYSKVGATGRLALPPMKQQKTPDLLYAKLLSKDDSYIPWKLLDLAIKGQSAEINDLTPLMQELPTKILTQSGLAEAIERMVRALYGWPGVWTQIATDKGKKRMKIHSASISQGKLKLKEVQLEGKTTTDFSDVIHTIV